MKETKWNKENMKSCTDLKQSKMLLDILSLKSADMYYWCGEDLRIGGHRAMDIDYDIPCWSLTALLGVIPQEIFDGEYIINITEGCDYRWALTYDHYENRKLSYYGLSTAADNLVDACYEMILKLHKHKMLCF